MSQAVSHSEIAEVQWVLLSFHSNWCQQGGAPSSLSPKSEKCHQHHCEKHCEKNVNFSRPDARHIHRFNSRHSEWYYPHHSVWQCTAKDIETAFITGGESDLTISGYYLWLRTPKLIPLMWIGQFTSAEQLIKNFTQKKILWHNRMRIEISVGVPWNSFENFGVLSPVFKHFHFFGSVLQSEMVIFNI